MTPKFNASLAIPEGFVLGKDMGLSSWSEHKIAVDAEGRVYCFVGYQTENQPRDLPYYSPSVAARERDGRSSFRFVQLRCGTLARSCFLRDDRYYRLLLDRLVILPSGANSYFGVVSSEDRREDHALSQSVFGGTFREIESVARALAGIVGRRHHEMVNLPRLTFSKTRDNACDLTGCLIPRAFPYLAFEDAQYDWSHVSLHGLYRLLAFMCPDRPGPVRNALLESGIAEDLLRRFVENAYGASHPLSHHQQAF